MNKRFFLVVAGALCIAQSAQPAGGNPFILTRSQGVNLARNHAGISQKMNIDCDEKTRQHIFSITAEYGQSFKPCSIARSLFGDDALCDCGDGAIINVTGSRVAGRSSTDWLADYFGLPVDYQSYINLSPRSQNFILDLGLYIDLDCHCEGLWLEFYAPFAYNRTSLRAYETTLRPGYTSSPNGYFVADTTLTAGAPTPVLVTRSQMNTSALEFLNSSQTNTALTIAPLATSKWATCKQSQACLADIRTKLGWTVCQNNSSHFSINISAAAPTGNRPTGEFLFEPIVGNGRHWELGGGLGAHYDFWNCPAENAILGIWADVTVSHLFKTRQTRTFDLKSSGSSRYMLAQELAAVQGGGSAPVAGGSATQLVYAGPVVANYQFNNAFAPVANLTCRDVDVTINLQVDFVAKLLYENECMTYELGYNYWGTSCEKIKKPKCNDFVSPFDQENIKYALKGDAFVFGFDAINPGVSTAADTAIALSATQSKATINSGLNFVGINDFITPNNPAVLAAQRNPNIDNANPAFAFTAAVATDAVVAQFFDDVANLALQTKSSKEPVLISEADVNYAGTKGFSHKIFGNISYHSQCRQDCLTPFIGFGFEAEFGARKDGEKAPLVTSNNSDDCSPCKSKCAVCTISQWGIWFKTGFTF